MCNEYNSCVRFELILKIVSTGKGGDDSSWFLLLLLSPQQKRATENGINLPGKCCRKSNEMKIHFSITANEANNMRCALVFHIWLWL